MWPGSFLLFLLLEKSSLQFIMNGGLASLSVPALNLALPCNAK